MRYLIDEGLPPDFSPELNRVFYPEFIPPPVLHIRDLGLLGVPDTNWMQVLIQHMMTYDEQWCVITRDRLRENRAIMFNSPLIFAILADEGWARARKSDLWQRLCKYWTVFQLRAASALAAPITLSNVFRVSYRYGRVSDYQPP